ncbi:omega-hydroxypalmitate O-feruloyl transferase [Punica granatum]|uniref:Omega-hydroxypalmitate O-feruloyl transferase n=1 Tax=Punica granatum TaxID=22663 RepID=A0A218WHL0_PUNGR|nr:omega-hydroxypalmitate O-feruloyl transferase [Punica granatum]OWM71701.1 hypothetical protein CDL15_Pgr005889 [Punica granatum]
MAPPLLVREVHFPELSIPITITRMIPVLPAGQIPASLGDTLYLSNLDDIIGARVFTPTVYFYRSNVSNPETARPVLKTIYDALADVLVPYYPLSGRLRETENGKLEVFFGPNQGALVVEARSKMRLEELGDLTVPNPAWEPLIYQFLNEEPYKILDMPLVIAQVTHFSCGGFSLGLRLCHCICDGLGAMQFLGAWAATAKLGRLVASPRPCWDREFFRARDPPIVKYPHIEFMRIDDGSSLTRSLWQEKPVQKCYKITREFQASIKALAQQEPGSCTTTFDAVAAHIWRSWVKALDVRPLDYELRLTFSVNARQKLREPLKEGFYGNAVCVACAVSKVSELVKGNLSETTSLVRQARLGISGEYLRSTIDYVEVNRPTRLEFGGKLTITQWTRFSIYESADFGWGRPVYAGPIDITPTPQVCVLLPEGDAKASGTMIVCICLPKEASDRFREFFCEINSTDVM